ncbi:MAG: urease accessory protein UreF [Leptolyngbyaceae cyanobacterium bins.349]|nr:urease accessory protein UreF [Leptolyngbyaceae cyanobacterium bins.349]
MNSANLLRLLQLASSTLPVGAYSYSEGLETLTDQGHMTDQAALEHWLTRELQYGSARLDAAIVLRSHRAIAMQDWPALIAWNRWLTAARETEELRAQNEQMGRSLLKLWGDLHPELATLPAIATLQAEGCQFAVAFAIAAQQGQLDEQSTLLGYVYSWVANLVSAGIKLIPLGQTAGQQTLVNLQPQIEQTVADVLQLADESLEVCGWGLAIASMIHETQYSRLFRS